MGLFGMLEDDDAAQIPVPKLDELSKADLMLMEKETTGIYLSGHPMDDYRHLLRRTRVVPIAQLLEEEIEKVRENLVPAVILIPGISGNTGKGIMSVKKSVEQAVGSDIIFND